MTDPRVPTVDELPDAMLDRDQWLCWRPEERDGKQTKVPIVPGTDAYASATDPETWRSFDTTRTAATRSGVGVGFVFTDDDPLVGVDLDDCRDSADGSLTADAREIVDRLDSFTEVSPSGTGVHVIAAGPLPAGRSRRGSVEMYADARFFTVTGDHVAEMPKAVNARPDALQSVHRTFVADDATEDDDRTSVDESRNSPRPDRDGNDLSDDELVARAREAANGDKFDRLYRGSTAGYPSNSEADMALCSLLAFWTGGDATQMDRLFRESGLYREKWDEIHYSDGATYGERTIERAITGTDEFYHPQQQGWTAIDSVERSGRSEKDADTVAGQPSASEETLATLRARLDELEAENERLASELAAERERRRELEQSQSDDGGWFSHLFGRN